jgi:uncharacterized phage protein gp47/JayE
MPSLPSSLDTSFSAIVERLLTSMGPRLDANAGSVARTLAEAYAREMATFYAMLERAHASGYLETAEGAALDNVVALLGVSRARAGRLTGQVEFRRSSPASEDIGIPAGRQVTGSLSANTPLPLFETTEDAVLHRGETRVLVAVQEVRDDSAAAQSAPSVIDPGRLTIMPRRVLGIEEVTNPAPLRRTSEDETDESLRARARGALREAGRGTLESIAAAVRQQGVQSVTVRERVDGPPGVIEVLIGDPGFERDLEAQGRVTHAIRSSKAAGIRADIQFARTVYFQPSFEVEPTELELDEVGFDRLRRELQDALARFAAGLPAGETVSRRKLEAALFGHPGVRRIGELTMATFAWGTEATTGQPALVREQRVRELGPTRDWTLDSAETAAIDLGMRPPLITRLRPLTYRLELVVSVGRTDRRTPEAVRRSVRDALEVYAALLSEDEELGIAWDRLELALKEHAGVVSLLALVVTDDQGLASQQVKGGPAFKTQKNARLSAGEVELVGVG